VADAGTLVVPVVLDALVVDKALLARDGFRRWQFNYLALNQFQSPEPQAFDRTSPAPGEGVLLHWALPAALRHGLQDPRTSEVEYPLVPNRWLVVRYMGTTTRTATAWVVESDCPFTKLVTNVTTAATSQYLMDPQVIAAWKASSDPYRSGVTLQPVTTPPQVANIGIPFPLADGWSERAEEPMFLTAVAPGNPYFATFTPHNAGVFSFYDALTGVEQGMVSYAVVGWYSDPARDILASHTLAELGWTTTGTGTPTRSLYEGLAFALPWQRAASAPPSPDPLQAVRDSGLLDVAIGNTTVDAFVALVGQQLQARGHDTQVLTLLRTFLYDLLPVAGQPGGDALVARAVEQSWFSSVTGGYQWAVVDRPSEPAAGGLAAAFTAGPDAAAAALAPGPRVAEGTVPEPHEIPPNPPPPAWLDPLNAAQAQLGALLDALYAAQWALAGIWYKAGLLPNVSFPTPPPGAPTPEQLAHLLDPTNPDGVTAPVLDLLGEVAPLLAQVPQPDWTAATTSQDAFLAGAEAFATAKGGLAADQMLAAVARPAFSEANNPVIVLSGVSAPTESIPGPDLKVRTGDQVIEEITVDKTALDPGSAGAAFPSPGDLGPLPSGVADLLTEAVILDPASAPSLAAASGLSLDDVQAAVDAHDPSSYGGTAVPPELRLATWTQPWQPMFLEWRVSHRSIPWTTGNQDNWAFDGSDYHYAPGQSSPVTDVRTVGGISLLAPEAQFVFANRIRRYVEQFGGPEQLALLDEWVQQIDGWQFLSQTLVGFDDLLACRDTRAFRRPTASDTVGTAPTSYPVATLAGFTGAPPMAGLDLPVADQGRVTSVPFLPNGPAVTFHGTRAAQLYFTDLILYDKFGRVLIVIEHGKTGLYTPENFPLVVDPALTPRTKIDTKIASVVEVPPRLLQPARLDIALLDGGGGSGVAGIGSTVNPVGGWLLPNHLDHGLLLYAGNGRALGEYRLVVEADGNRVGTWQPPPHDDLTPSDLARLAPLVAAVIGANGIATPDGFAAFLDAIDNSLWTVDPLGGRTDQNLSVLVGRPLALVRARLTIGLSGPPLRDVGWAATLDPPDPEFVHDDFAIRLGDQAARDDGLMGYYAGQDYDTFNSVAAPAAGLTQSYVTQIGPLGTTPGNYIHLTCAPGTSTEVTLLMDPRAAVHAVTGILPVTAVRLPGDAVGAGLGALEVTFSVGPLPTFTGPTPTQTGQTPPFPDAVTIPAPAEQAGLWSWWQPSWSADEGKMDWAGFALVAAVPDAQFRAAPTVAAEGALQFVTDLSHVTRRPEG
jgi:hypothetical protein